MLLLAIDVGNTNIVLGAFQDDSLVRTWRAATDVRRTEDELVALLDHFFQREALKPRQVGGVVLGNVVPALQEVLERAVHAFCGRAPWTVGPAVQTGLLLRVDEPAELGADRIANAVAAYRRHGGPVIVVDLGTATTFDVISSTGEYLGGVIAPGLQVSAEALALRAARLYGVQLSTPAAAIGRNTATALRSGLIFGTAALVEGMVERIRRELGGRTRVLATGGLARLVARETRVIDELDPDLTLQGLRLLYELNHPRTVPTADHSRPARGLTAEGAGDDPKGPERAGGNGARPKPPAATHGGRRRRKRRGGGGGNKDKAGSGGGEGS